MDQHVPNNFAHPPNVVRPPQDEDFYRQFLVDIKRGMVHWDKEGAMRRLAQATGLNDAQSRFIIRTALPLLPAHRTNMKSRRFVNQIARTLLADTQAARLLRPRYPHSPMTNIASEFYETIAQRWVMVANGQLPKPVAGQVPAVAPAIVQGPIQQQAQPVPMPPVQAPGAGHHAVAMANEEPRENAANNDAAGVGTEDGHLGNGDAQQPNPVRTPGSNAENAITIPEDEEENVKVEEEENVERGHTTNNTATTAPILPSPDVGLRRDMIQLRYTTAELATGTNAHMADMFGMPRDPNPAYVRITAVRVHWIDHLRIFGLPVVEPGNVWFRFPTHGPDVRINNDVALRLAYRLWISMGDRTLPFTLFVDHV